MIKIIKKRLKNKNIKLKFKKEVKIKNKIITSIC